ncbi:alpha/beta hydrolase [Cupriavidus basilensis]
MTDAEFEYVTGQSRPTSAALLSEFEARSAAAIHTENCQLDPRLWPCATPAHRLLRGARSAKGNAGLFPCRLIGSRGTRRSFRFIAPAFTRIGLHVALVNYPLCPAVSLGALIEAASASIGAIGAHAAIDGQLAPPLVLAGHSAGGHIAVELALLEAGRPQAHTPAIAGVVALSGIYDLAPLVGTSLNRNLMLDTASAAMHSPLQRLKPGLPGRLVCRGRGCRRPHSSNRAGTCARAGSGPATMRCWRSSRAPTTSACCGSSRRRSARCSAE